MNLEKLGPKLSFTVENKANNKGCSYFKHNEWDIPLPQILRIYQWIGKNMFSMEKNEFLKPSWIGKDLNKNVDYLMYYPSWHMSNENCKSTFKTMILWGTRS